MSAIAPPATVLETPRLRLREFVADDAAFVLRLVNEPSWLEFIGDKGVRTQDDARAYLASGPIAMYARHGFGLWLVERRDDGAPIGMCGLIRRDNLDDVDLGFALLPEYWGCGYAHEAAAATMAHGRDALDLARIVAIASPSNARSIRLIERLGMVFERQFQWGGHEEPTALYGSRY
jgi:RimJ/RimL family protein N-acetyltransferase